MKKLYKINQFTAEQWDSIEYDWNEHEDEIVIIEKKDAYCMDITANGKRIVPILRKIEEAMTAAGLAGETGIFAGWFGEWANELTDRVDRKYFIWNYSGQSDRERGCWSYSWGIEQIDDDRWYIFLNIAKPQEETEETEEQTTDTEEEEEEKTMKQYKVSSNRVCDGQKVENITCSMEIAQQLAESAKEAGHTNIMIEEEEEEQTMKPENKLYLSNWDYNAALIIEELAAIVENNGGTVKPGTVAIIENRALNTNIREAAARLEQLERIEAENPGTNEKRTDAMKRLRADIEKWQRIDNSPRTVHHCTWSSAYISFKLGGMYYYYQTDSNPFFDFHYQKTPIDVNGTVSCCACLESDTKEWLWDCFLRAEATDADRREAANLIYNMLVKAAPSVIRRDSRRVRVRNQYDGRYHYETIYEKERREAVNF